MAQDQLSEGHLTLLETIYDVLRTQDRWPPYRSPKLLSSVELAARSYLHLCVGAKP